MLTVFLIIAVLIGVFCSFSYYQIQKVNQSYSDLVERQTSSLTNVKDIQLYASQVFPV